MVSRVLPRKLRRDLWRQRWQFAAVTLVIAIGVAVYVGATDAYRNLGESFDQAYATQRLPDAVVSGPGAANLSTAGLPGRPQVTVRQQGDVGIRVHGHTLLGRAVGIPAAHQAAVARLALRSGDPPGTGQLVVEQHLADHYGLRPGDTIELRGPSGWRTVRVAGSALSTEYFWPARSPQEVMTTPEHFGVVFVPDGDVAGIVTEPVDQVLLYADDRAAAGALVTSAARLAAAHGLLFASREEQPSYRALREDVAAVGNFANLLPWVFLAAAVLGTYVLLSRLVTAQRAVIGTLVANGLSPGTLRRHYLGYGIAAGVAGAIPGLVGGYVLGSWFTTAYTSALGLPLDVTGLHPASLLVGTAAAVAAAAVAAWVPARAAARMHPAEAMRTAPPAGRGRRSVLERLIPPLRRAPARWRMTLRAVTRNRRRTILTVTGVAVSVSLVLVFAGMRDTVSSVIDRQFGQVERQNAEVTAAPGAAAAALASARSDRDVTAAEPVGRYDIEITAGDRRYETLLVALPRRTTMHDFGAAGGLPASGVVLAEGLRETLAVSVGDRVEVRLVESGRRVTERVTGFVAEPMTAVAYTSLDGLGATGALLRLRPGTDERALSDRLTADSAVVAYLSTGSLETTMREAFSLYDTLVGLMLTFAALMAAALLFNALSANLAERLGELGTLRAAGMGAGVLARLIATENLVLAVLGIPVGLAAGTLLAGWFMSTYETQGYHWNLDMSPTTPLLVAAGVLTAALVAQLPAVRAVRHLDVARIVRERSL